MPEDKMMNQKANDYLRTQIGDKEFLIAMLRGTIGDQANEIAELKKQIEEFQQLKK